MWLEPLRPLARAVASFSRGERPIPLASQAEGELFEVCHAFNTMVDTIYNTRDELGGINTDLEQQIRVRTGEVRRMNEKLEAEAADKNEFLRAVTHDLNAPLRNIIGMVGMVMMKHGDKLPDDAVNKLQRIEANARHQTELISDLLELSHLRTRKPNPERVDLRELLDGILSNLSHDLETAQIQLSLEGDLPVIVAERTRIRQVFQNLIDNAIKYMMDSETRQIVVSGQRTRDFQPNIFEGLDVLQFAVADTGRGIAAQDVDSVFQVFKRSTHSGTHEVAGRGVGLASVRTIVDQMGGRIWVESVLNIGSTFTFTMPAETALRLDVPAPSTPAGDPVSQSPADAPTPSSNLCVRSGVPSLLGMPPRGNAA
jgi:signal transduction histidine kinase